MSIPYDYKVSIERPDTSAICDCGDTCGWTGTFADLNHIEECSLTPGDPSPAGRCPECNSLAYVAQPTMADLLQLVGRLTTALDGMLSIDDWCDDTIADLQMIANAQAVLEQGKQAQQLLAA